MGRRSKDPKTGFEVKLKRLPTGKRVRVSEGDDESALMDPEKARRIYSNDKATQIVDAYMRGMTMKAIAELEGMPPVETLYYWMQNHAHFRERMKEARKLRGLYFEERALEHAEAASEIDVQSRKLKIDTMKWAAEVNDRETYGKSTKITGDANQPLAFIIDTGIRREELPPTDAIEVQNSKGPAATEESQ